ncbi:hypothetical protein GCM10025857_15560 [Alicyclobacillus contaminans]|uniref:alpha/beta hydrolase n=1 Tax=Alicyclobacillus contaminans TaxID=392016 RepID=UPI00040014A2|nr:alpha/beta hydrolase-fold protein [Alicyclobacillus contaminans]GMA50199.1 hypothetical protein GCM10025857_15560 [Alicyclobacillus contaminans]
MPELDQSKRRIETHTIYSAHLSEERTIKVFLPPGYREDENYPVMYCHDGLEFFTHGRIATIASQRMADGLLDPLVIVGIAVHKQTRTDDYSPDGARHAAYSRFVLQECVPFVEQQYAVGRTSDRRFMAGISLGAAASLSIHLQARQEFRQLLLFSGAFYENVRSLVRDESDLSNLSAYMVVGQEETAVDIPSGPYDFYRANQAMRSLLLERGARIDYHEAPGTHIWGFWQKQMPDALLWLQRQLTALGS